MTKVIAEIGWNHMGDMKLAKKMIKAAKDNGAWAAKFQVFNTSRLKDGPWDEDGRREIYEKAQLSKEDLIELRDYCRELDIVFFASVFSIEDAKILAEVDNEYIKIASAECRNSELIKYVVDNFKTIIVSTGATTIEELNDTLKILPLHKTVLLHCISLYPCDPSNANLMKIELLKQAGTTGIGYSCHCEGVEVAKVALELDIDVIEKHFTIDNDLPGRDNKFAILPEELKNLTDYIEMRQGAKNLLTIDFLPEEIDVRNVYSGRFDKNEEAIRKV